MFILGANILIAGKRFTRVHEVQIESSMKVLEDRARIKVPRTARLTRAGEYLTEVETAKEFKVGDPVVIQLGYDGDLQDEFHGYVSKIKPTTPLEIECEDATWILKRKNLKASFKNATLEELLNYVLKDTGISLAGKPPVINFKLFYFKNTSAAKALQEFKDKYGLTIYFKSINQLFVGLATDDDGVTVKYKFGFNVIDNELEWVSEDDVKLQIKAVHIRSNNTKIEQTVGDSDGEKRTLFFYDLESEADLKKRAQEEILKYKYSGYKGAFKAFLLPNLQVGNIVRIIDDQYEERQGSYLAEKIVTSYGRNGARRKIYPGLKVSN